MTEERLKRIEQKYSDKKVESKKAFALNNRGAGRAAAMSSSGRPKNTRHTAIRLFKYISREKTLFIIALLCTLFHTLLTLAASQMLRPVINTIKYQNTDFKKLTLGIIVMAVIYAFARLMQWLQSRLMLSVSQRSMERMRNELYSHLQTLPISYFDRNKAGDIMSRFTNDVDAVSGMLSSTLVQLFNCIITIIGTVILMLYNSLILGGITLVMTPLLIFVSKTLIKKGRGAYKEQQKSLGILNGFTEESISGQKAVKVFNHEGICEDEFNYLSDRLKNAQIKAQFRAGIMGPVTHQLCNIIYAVTASVGGILIALKGYDVGGLTVSLNFTRHFNRPINEISMQFNTVFSALAGAERVFEVMDISGETEPQNVIEKGEIKGEIELKNVTFSYVEGIPVLKNISLKANRGKKVAFVGSTGAGKTTITNLLTRFYDIVDGEILIDGINIKDMSRKYLRKNIAMVLQDTHLFSGTVMENIRYGRLDATNSEVIAAAKVASAHEFIMQLENGYDTYLTNDGANLSEGQRQLINIARAAISKAPILVLDEATSSVDTRTERHIEEGMDYVMKDRTTFIIAHRLSTVRKSDVIVVLSHGEIIESGSHEELIKKGGRYYDLYNEIAELD
ncbi:MAG: ABC transporter ATP-binding protein [Clostridia bacterium]|nr:ABC transporter ATP-binding protein [Clostridia bacterium]